MKKIRTAVVGVGYLGKFHAQKYAALEGSELVGVADADPARAAEVAGKVRTRAFTDHRELIGAVDAVSIAVPTTLHYPIAKDFLSAGVHVLLEKPVTQTVAEAEELIGIAARGGLVFMPGHLERFNPAVLSMLEEVRDPIFVESHRLAPFRARGTEVSVVLDLMIHDIDLILSIVRSEVLSVDSRGGSVLSDETDIANARITFSNGCVANVTASRVSREFLRKMRIFQPDAYLTVDFQKRALSLLRRGGDGMSVPELPGFTLTDRTFGEGDALLEEIRSFLSCVSEGATPPVTGEDGRDALKIAQMVAESFASGGLMRPVRSPGTCEDRTPGGAT